MSQEYLAALDLARQSAVSELTGLVKQRYPTTAFTVGPGEDDPDVTHITAIVDVDDPDEVVDMVIDRMLELQFDHGVPVYLIPIRTLERVAAVQSRQQSQLGQRSAALSLPQQPVSAQ